MAAPSDLIHQLQSGLRKEAGVGSYDPDDPTLTDLPSLQQVIEGLDPSPPYLRCKQCRGRLLRGLESIVCVYCGAQPQRSIPPDPIPFKSTFGYRCLLQSLDLDGSEAVEVTDSNKWQNASKNARVLSDLFNIELKWPAESEKNGTYVANKTPNQIKNPLNLAGVDLDNFFSETKKEIVPSVSEQMSIPDKPVNIIEPHAFPGQGTLSLFENTQSFETLVRPTEGVADDPSSGWEAEFQSAGVRALPVESKALDRFPDAPPIDLSLPLKAPFGSAAEIKFEYDGINKNIKEKNILGSHTSTSDSWIQDDQWHTSNVESSTKIVQLEMKSEAIKDGDPTDDSDNVSSMDNNLIQDDLWLTSSEKRREDEESFDAWQDFTSSGNAPNHFPSSSNLTSLTKTSTDELVQENNLASLSNNFQEMEFGSFMAPDIFPGTTGLSNASTSGNNVQEGSYPDRLVEVNTGDLKSTENTNGSFDAAMGPESAVDTVETLMSQMHDLSFMLDSNLCIPQKEDGH